jgi:hypothetical protein
MTVSVNGEKVTTASVNSGGWQKVGKKTLTIQLQPGRNTIRLSNPTNWLPDIDYIDVVSTSAAGIVEREWKNDNEAGAVYDLQGRRVSESSVSSGLSKAIYINNGRKVVADPRKK